MKEQLEAIRAGALAAIGAAGNTGELEALRVQYLGKKGELTAVLKQMGKLSAEERYFRELEAREPLPVVMDFSAGVTPAHVSGPAVPAYETADYTAKL